MIWIVEHLSIDEKQQLGSQGPYIHYFQRNMAHHYDTFCAGYEIVNLRIREIRRIRFDDMSNINRGLICLDLEDAMRINNVMYDIDDVDTLSNMPNVVKYLSENDNMKRAWTWIPLESFVKYFAEYNSKVLNNLDLGLLQKTTLDLQKYFKYD